MSWPLVLFFLLRSCLAEHVTDDECLGATSFLQKSVEPIVPIALDATAGSQCMAEDLEKVLKGLKESKGQNLNKYLGFPMILLLCGSLLVLLAGHRLVNIVVLTSVILATFFLTFEFLWQVLHHSCSAPVWVGIIVAIIVPGALFGAILSYQIQAILLTASPQLESNVFMEKYYFIIAILAAIIFGYLAHKLKDDVFILLTAVLGAYGFEIALRGILLDYFECKMSTLASLISMVSAFIVGLVVQHRNAK
mmetsp:Transcript_68869/g.139648  ORF Transcript_68869/g.139648 Transcript_68869/m.139648 type:complete len:250 (-) Transcript_68869:119-868(-)